MYKVLRMIVHVFLKVCFRYEAAGTENIPSEGGVLLCGNHVSALDALIIACPKGVPEVCFMAKAELLNNGFIKWLAGKVNIVGVKRGAGDIAAMRKAIELVNSGSPLVLFPEGTRSKDGKLGEGKNGAALIAKRSGCAVVPCAINGKPRLFKKVRVLYKKPVCLDKYFEEKNLDGATEEIMKEIALGMEELNAGN